MYDLYAGAPERGDGGDDDDYYERRDEWEAEREPDPALPAVTGPFEPPGDGPAPSGGDRRGRRLQVIVKIATIALTPARPRRGGAWRRGHDERADRRDIVHYPSART